jgi:hypothetical protein
MTTTESFQATAAAMTREDCRTWLRDRGLYKGLGRASVTVLRETVTTEMERAFIVSLPMDRVVVQEYRRPGRAPGRARRRAFRRNVAALRRELARPLVAPSAQAYLDSRA